MFYHRLFLYHFLTYQHLFDQKYKFDESIEAWEDILWAKQVQAEGYKIIYEPNTAVHHYHIEDPSKTLDRYKKEQNALEKIYKK